MTCTVPGCHRAPRAAGTGNCAAHYQQARKPAAPRAAPTPIDTFPSRPKRVTDALHALAETPNLTPAEYERRKREILRGATP